MFWRGVTTAAAQIIAPEEKGEKEERREEERGRRKEESIEWRRGTGGERGERGKGEMRREREEGQEEEGRGGEKKEMKEERIEWKGEEGEVVNCLVAYSDSPNKSVSNVAPSAPPVVDSIRAVMVGSILTGWRGPSMT